MRVDQIKFDEFILDIELREIHSPYKLSPVRLTLKQMAVLTKLIEHPGRLVSREFLKAEVWPNTVNAEGVLLQAIYGLRKALVRPRSKERCIQTIPKSGYRLRATVEFVQKLDPCPSP